MQEVFELIFQGIQFGFDMLKGFSISAWGFSFSLWDILLAIFVLSFFIPLVVAPDHSGSFLNISRWFTRSSERNSKKDDDKKVK